MIHYLNDSKIKNKVVLLRVDVNVPVDEDGKVEDSFRIEAILPTINFLLKNQCKIIICGHLGRPDIKKGEKASLSGVASKLSEFLKLKFVETEMRLPKYKVPHLVFFTGNIQEESVRLQIKQAVLSNIVFLENLRHYSGEETDDGLFAKQLAELAEVYINDAFAVSHREDASVHAVARYLPGFAGLLLEKEIKALSYVLNKPKSPFICMMGGIKIKDKIKTIEHLATKADKILIGGGIANLIFLSRGFEIGLSKVEKEGMDLAWQIDRNLKGKIILPVDAVVANSKMDKKSIRVVEMYDVKPRELILDIGPKSILLFANYLKKAQTVVWNGPMGHFEVKPFHTGTVSLARVIGGVSKGRAFGVAGGGETVDSVRLSHQQEYYDHLSTGGGAMLEYLAGHQLPGIVVLDR
jgi:phosphoglycerate kinase